MMGLGLPERSSRSRQQHQPCAAPDQGKISLTLKKGKTIFLSKFPVEHLRILLQSAGRLYGASIFVRSPKEFRHELNARSKKGTSVQLKDGNPPSQRVLFVVGSTGLGISHQSLPGTG